MSDQTRRDLAEAIAAHVADELDGALTGAWTAIHHTDHTEGPRP